ncbi:MAG: hypothetical protein LC776_03245, partial [Acidobacteria bacterium]|nr:hypothetical protein [Acidobacteriota bacterium]
MTIEYEQTSLRLIVTFLVLVGVYVLVWVFWERIPELAGTLPYYEKTFELVSLGMHKAEGARDFVLNSTMSEYVWKNRSMFAGGYALLGLLMLVNPIYRNGPERFTMFCRTGCMVLGGILLLIGLMWLGTALDGILKPRPASSYPTGIWPNVSAGAWIGRIFFGTLYALLMIAFGLVILIGFYGGIYIG